MGVAEAAGGELVAGEVLAGALRVLEKVGEGGMCEVFRAEEAGLGRQAAVKVLRPHLSADERERLRFLREAKLCGRLSHPGIVAIHGTGEWRGRPYLVMPFIEGTTLRARITAGLSLAPALELLVMVAEALAYAHGEGVVHRDLKPENVLVTRDGRALVADWGLARVTEDPEHLTATGTIVGTPAYMAPELIAQGKVTPLTDLYAFGAMLYEAVAGRVPFRGEEPARVLRAHLDATAAPLSALVPGVPRALSALAAALLAKDPASRPATAEAVARELRAMARAPRSEGATSLVRSAVLPRPPVPPAQRARRAPWALALLGVGVAVAALALRRGVEPTPGREGPRALAVLAVKLAAPDRLEVLFKGPPSGRLRARFVEAGLPAPGEVSLDSARPVGSGHALVLPLARSLLRPADVRLELRGAPGTEPTTFLATLLPGPLLDGLLEPLDRLAGGRLDELLRRVADVRWRHQVERSRGGSLATTAAARDAVLRAFDGSGLDAAALSRLREWLPRLVGPGLYADDALSLRLAPLRALEASLAGSGDLASPLGAWSERLGVGVHERDTYRDVAAQSLSVVGSRDFSDAPGAAEPGLSLLVAAGHFSLITRAAGLRSFNVHAALAEDRRATPSLGSLYRTTFTLAPPKGRAWPPRRARLDLHLRSFHRGFALRVRVQSLPPVLVFNTSDVASQVLASGRSRPLLALVSLDPERLRPGPAPVSIEVLDVPVEVVSEPMGLLYFSLLTGW